MIENRKFSSIEKLKMTRAEEYDYNKFLSDSSDDYPKYEDLVKDAIKHKEVDDHWFYSNKFNSIENNINYSGSNIALAKSDNDSQKNNS